VLEDLHPIDVGDGVNLALGLDQPLLGEGPYGTSDGLDLGCREYGGLDPEVVGCEVLGEPILLSPVVAVVGVAQLL